MRLFVYALDSALFEGEVEKVSLPTDDGEITVLPGHISLVTTLQSGSIVSEGEGGEAQEFRIKKGLARVSRDAVVVLAE